MSKQNYEDSSFIQKWVEHNKKTVRLMYPELDEYELEDYLYKLAEKSIKVPSAKLVNTHRNKQFETDLLTIVDWIEKTDPIISGYGALFRPHSALISPSSKMLDTWMKERDVIKGKLYLHDKNSAEYRDIDNQQNNVKITANSYYGSAGAPSSRFYNLTVAAATTLTGQILISTPGQSFEMFLSNSVKFINIDNFIDYTTHILNSMKDYKFNMALLKQPDYMDVVNRFVEMFYDHDTMDVDIMSFVESYLSSLSDEELKVLYYKNNLYEVMRQSPFIDILVDVLDSPSHMEFLNPDKPPAHTKKLIDKLWEMLYDVVYVHGYIPMGRVRRMRYDRGRRSTIYMDTDSNMVTVREWVEFCQEIIDKTNVFKNKVEDDIYITSVNTISHILTLKVRDLLNYHTGRCNIDEEHRKVILMKNEYLFPKMLLGTTKKRYITPVMLREGDYFDEQLLDIKGYEFIKSSTTKEVRENFVNNIRKNIIEPDSMDPIGAIQDLSLFETEITESLKRGEKKYLLPFKAKAPEAYAYPLREQSVRGVMAWNAAYPFQQIQSDEQVYVVKVNMDRIEDIEDLMDTQPEIYDRLKKDIYESPNKEVRDKGINVIAIPRNVETVPEWIIPYIMIQDMTARSISKFNPVLESLGVSIIAMDNTSFYTNIKSLG